ncbi:diphthine synthase [Candidatus Woesearchaeota archaeon]|nr:diphthine synthase [Candidatus Woesearchaeota archaeon]
MFYLIGIGMGDEKDITVKGLEAVKSCDKIFLECYTSKQVDFDIDKMQEFYGKEIIFADRDMVEKNCEDEMIMPAREGNVALLIVGSPLGATTHLDILRRADDLDVESTVIDNAGILGAVGIVGMSLYKYGRVITIPKENEGISSPYEMMVENQKMGLHTLILLDVKNENEEFNLMTARKGLDYLIKHGLSTSEMVVVCGGLGGAKPEIKYGGVGTIFVEKKPQCIIVPGDMHFMEEECVERFKV